MAESVLVTGATGLLGGALVRHFAAQRCRVFAAVRNVEKARAQFGGMANVEIVEWDVTKMGGPRFGADATERVPPVDWLVHAASETASRMFVERPVETISSILDGTRNVLEYAKSAKVGAMVYLSTMEVYGAPTAENVTERDYGYLDPVSVRSSYPEAKRMAENLCVAYAKEYSVPAKIARLTQTFGEGVRYDDARVFAAFARAIIERRDIVLKTEGTTARCYCYLDDAVTAIETILSKGEVAVPYTVANEETFCTIREMAEALCAAHPESRSRVVFDFSDAASQGFAPPFRMRLDCSRLRALGWAPRVGLIEAFDRMIADMRRGSENGGE